MAAQLPSPLSRIVDDQGRPTREFYEWLLFRDRLRLGDLQDVDTSGATDGQQLTYVAADDNWTPDTA